MVLPDGGLLLSARTSKRTPPNVVLKSAAKCGSVSEPLNTSDFSSFRLQRKSSRTR